MPTVAILGCGPAGLFAAQAFAVHGHHAAIISRKTKSEIYGAQYLHKPIPEFCNTEPDGYIKTTRLGTREGYAKRVYGRVTTKTSWDKVQDEPQPAWDLRRAYDRAWNKFESIIVDSELGSELVKEFIAHFDIVVSTIPLWSICERQAIHKFKTVPIMVSKEMEYTGLPDHYDKRNGGVVYNGTEYGSWYRTSTIFGHQSTEATTCNKPVMNGWDIGFKVAGTNCNCHPDLIKAGRMGKWERGVLTHHAFSTSVEALAELEPSLN